MSPLFLATIEATEEAIYNSLFMATKIKDVEPLPIDRTIEILKKYGVIRNSLEPPDTRRDLRE